MSKQTIIVSSDESKIRIDYFLSKNLTEITRSYIKKLILDEHITVNKKKIKPNYKVNINDEIHIEIPPIENLSNVFPENIPLNVIFEDKDIIIINKSSGMTVHPAHKMRTGTLVGALLYHCKDLSGIGGIERPGIVHRLDKDTSGIIICAKNDKSHVSLSSQFKERKIKKIYTALTLGAVMKDRDIINRAIGRHLNNRKKISTSSKRGKTAITEFEVLERYKNNSLLKIILHTGRTHQIRVHLASIGHPVLGDKTYGKGGWKKMDIKISHLLLHAKTIGFMHPQKKEYMEFSAPLPEYFNKIILKLGSVNNRPY